MVIGGAASVAINNLNNMNRNGDESIAIGMLIGFIIAVILIMISEYDYYVFNKWLRDPIHNRRDWWNIFGGKE